MAIERDHPQDAPASTGRVSTIPWASGAAIAGSERSNSSPMHGRRCSKGVDLLPLRRGRGWCSKGVELVLDGYPKLVAIDEEPDHEIVHSRRLGKAARATDEPFNPRPQI